MLMAILRNSIFHTAQFVDSRMSNFYAGFPTSCEANNQNIAITLGKFILIQCIYFKLIMLSKCLMTALSDTLLELYIELYMYNFLTKFALKSPCGHSAFPLLIGSYNMCGTAGTAVPGTWLKVKCSTPTVARYVITQV